MDESNEPKKAKTSKKKTVSRTVCILIALLAVVLGGLAGYAYGTDKAKSDAEAEYQEQISALEGNISGAQSAVSAKSDADQQSIESLQSENATLKQTNEALKKQIADLEEQLEQATTTPPVSQ